jgi:hypothetical protein
MRPFAAAVIALLLAKPMTAQLLSDPLEGDGDETYTGGFGAFNWVDAANYGFANHAGAEAFLSNYTGTPLSDIGMEKPLNATIGNGTYRVSFYYSRYSSINPGPYSSYDYLYIGSPNGTMDWDTVPTPTVSGEWVRWSGVFTPDVADIGQPFRFGFSMELISGTSLAIDGPLEIVDLATGIIEPMSAHQLQVWHTPGAGQVVISHVQPMSRISVRDAMGRLVPTFPRRTSNGWEINVEHLRPGHYSVLCADANGMQAAGRFMVI